MVPSQYVAVAGAMASMAGEPTPGTRVGVAPPLSPRTPSRGSPTASPDPPLVAVVIDHRHTAYPLLEREGAAFAVNVLGQEQVELSNRFAWLKDEDRFGAGDWSSAVTGAPVLRDAVAWLDCRVWGRQSAGTHSIYVGEVCATSVPHPDEPPLVYWNRGYRKLLLRE